MTDDRLLLKAIVVQLRVLNQQLRRRRGKILRAAAAGSA